MKTITDPRHQRRSLIIKDLFAQSFHKKQPLRTSEAREIFNNLKSVDEQISKNAPLWPIDKIGKVDLAILRLAVYELKIAKIAPPKVVIDEAVELAKEFGTEASAPFVNGVLGSIMAQNT